MDVRDKPEHDKGVAYGSPVCPIFHLEKVARTMTTHAQRLHGMFRIQEMAIGEPGVSV